MAKKAQSVLERLAEKSTIKESAILSESNFFDIDTTPTPIPMLNVALSGRIDGGLKSGILIIAGASKTFKTIFTLLLGKVYLEKYEDDGAGLFYDSEHGSTESTFDKFGPQQDRLLHTPLTDLEMFKHDFVNQLDNIKRGDHIITLVDSLGMLASKKEIEDTRAGKTTADMTRAKSIKSFFRMITPHVRSKDVPVIIVNHVYKDQGLFPRDIVSGGTGPYLSADDIWIVTRKQDKDGKELMGFDFIINIEKSRWLREKTRIPISANFQTGINKFSGLLEEALESGHVEEVKPEKEKKKKNEPIPDELKKKGEKFFKKKGTDESTAVCEENTNTEEFWKDVLADKTFIEAVNNRYKL